MNREILKIIADNPALSEALRTLFEEKFSLDEIETKMTNEAMGQVVRARVEGLKKIAKAFQEIDSYRSFAEKPHKENPAR